MRLDETKKHWDRFARTDPLWAVLTDGSRKGNRWQVDEFFQTGVDTVEGCLRDVRVRLPALRTGSALDFGCGVGRLSQALARHFDRVTGVDISADMLAHARRYDRHPGRVEYVLNTAPDLAQFATGRFDFVCSLITLQHIAPEYARAYLAELVRVAAPGGAILVQLPALRPRRPFTLRPDILLNRLGRYLYRRFGPEPFMEMHAIPRAEVEAILTRAGARVLECRCTDPDIQLWSYLATKP